MNSPDLIWCHQRCRSYWSEKRTGKCKPRTLNGALWVMFLHKSTDQTPTSFEARRVRCFSLHLPCEIAEANFRRFQWFSPRFSSTFNPICCNQLRSILIWSKTQELLTTARRGKQHVSKGIPMNVSSQVWGEVRVNFVGRFPTKPFILGIEGPNCSENSWEGFGWFFAIERFLRSRIQFFTVTTRAGIMGWHRAHPKRRVVQTLS